MPSSTAATPAPRIILGIDPGTQVMGYGVIEAQGQNVRIRVFGTLHLSKYADHALKLRKIYERVSELIETHAPDSLAIEAPFYGKNVQSMLKLGRAQGVALAAALAREIPVAEYMPKTVKQSVTGNGNASKEQVAAMLKQILEFDREVELHDETDALAVAVCHHFASKSLVTGLSSKKNSKKGWEGFVSENPDRLKK